MSEKSPMTTFEKPVDNRWEDAVQRVDEVVRRNHPGLDEEALSRAIQDAQAKLATFGEQERLKLVEVQLDNGTNMKTLSPVYSETHAEGLPVGDVIEYLGYGDSHEFASGQPKADWYLPTLARLIDKPLIAYVEGLPVTEVAVPEMVDSFV